MRLKGSKIIGRKARSNSHFIAIYDEYYGMISYNE
jgi:hypothetical protein